ncbi:MAG: hypothetical protein NTY88_08660 [Bacteroidetes bacterium]|nr:hypothetical protein [Bacteroidota bacterium]
MKFIFASFFFLLAASSSAVDIINFDMFLFGDKIGVMTVTHEIKPDGTEVYSLESNSKAKFLWLNYVNYTRYDVAYKDGKLFSSVHKDTENGKTKRWTNITWDGIKYSVDSYKGKRSFLQQPDYSIVTIYFKDIKNVKKIFYEAEADFNEMKKADDPETWEFKSSDGNRNIYHFSNGKIKAMEFHVTLATIKMVRSN